MDARARFALLLIAAVACTNAAAPGPTRVPWPVALLAFVLWLVASSLAVCTPRRRGDV